MHPLFSIITVTYNASTTLPTTIESVKSQTCPLYEHIIMDGASKDATISMAQDYANSDSRVKFVSKPDKGIYDAMNRAISVSKGDYLIFLNAGDKFHSPDTLQNMADALMDADYPGILYGQTDIVDSQGKRLGDRHLHAPAQLTLDSFKNGMVVCHQSFIVHRSIAPLYNLKYKYSSDYEWCIICLQHSRRNLYFDEVITDYLNEGATTRNRRKSLAERYDIMCTYYGWLPTTLRHFKFFFRNLFRKKLK